MPWALAGLGIGAGAGLMGNILSASDRNKAIGATEGALQQWLNINVPDPQQQQVILQRYQMTGQLDPQIEQAMKMGPSAFEQIQNNPQLMNAQMNALDQLQQEGLTGGMDIRDQATMQQAINDSNAAARGRAGSIMDQMQQRGMGDSGAALSAQLQNAQNANQTQSSNELQAAAASRQRALDAIMGGGQLAGQMQQQQYGQQANLARARDAINQFNTTNMQNVLTRNTNRANEAQQYNVGLQQQLANMNTGLANQQQMYNKNLIQQNYENQLQKAGGMQGAYGNMANAYNNAAAGTSNMFAGIGGAAAQGGSAYQGYLNNQQQLNQQQNQFNQWMDRAYPQKHQGNYAGGDYGYGQDEEGYYA